MVDMTDQDLQSGSLLCPALIQNSNCNLTALCADLFQQNLTTSDILNEAMEPQTPLWEVWTVGLFMVTVISGSAACGIAILPFLSEAFYRKALTFFVALGAGTLSGNAVFHLIPEAFDLESIPDYLRKSWMVISGIYLFFIVDKLINLAIDFRTRGTRRCDKSPEAPLAESPPNTAAHSHSGDHIASVAWLVVFSDGLHNFIDGLSIGVAFKQSLLSGMSVSLAVLCEEFPQELGDCAILISSGMSPKQALVYNLLSAATCYVGFVLGVLIGELDPQYSALIFALAAGMFLYISLCGLLSRMNQNSEDAIKKSIREGAMTLGLQFAGLVCGIGIMFMLAD